MQNIEATLGALPALTSESVEAFRKRCDAFLTLSADANRTQSTKPVQDFYSVMEAIEAIAARKDCTAIVHVPATPAKANWLSTVTIDDCQRALNTLSYLAAAAFVGMAVITVCFLIGCYMAGVVGYRAWVRHRMGIKVRAFATVAARKWVAGVSVICFEGWPIVRALVAYAAYRIRRKRQVLSLYPAS